jgi:hypothetical protein
MKYIVFKKRDNTLYCFGYPIGLELSKMLSPTVNRRPFVGLPCSDDNAGIYNQSLHAHVPVWARAIVFKQRRRL